MNEKLLIVDDEKHLTEILKIAFEKEGYNVTISDDARKGLDLFNENGFDLVITDIKMEGMNGIELLKRIKNIDKDVFVILMTAFSSFESAVEALRAGANDYIVKPFEIDEIIFRVKSALKHRRLVRGVQTLKKEKLAELEIIGKSHQIKELKQFIEKVKDINTTILISGESGTGKELIARKIHYSSPRVGRFVPLNCAAIPENLLESELFGYKKGAFTGATSNKEGLFKAANGGTLFLDEISELPLLLQPKLLRVMQNQEFVPVGGTKPERVDVRIISATNKNLNTYIKEGKFREDLFFRLNVIPLHIPPLRERKEDIPLLIDFFLKKISHRLGMGEKNFSKDAIQIFMAYPWPGNVRELENLIERIYVLESERVISGNAVKKYFTHPTKIKSTNLKNLEKEMIIKTLEETGGNKKLTAKILGIHISTLYRKLKNGNI